MWRYFCHHCGGIFVNIVEVFLTTQARSRRAVALKNIQMMSKILASGWTNWYFESLKNQLYIPKLPLCWDISPSCQLFESLFWPYNYFDILCQKCWNNMWFYLKVVGCAAVLIEIKINTIWHQFYNMNVKRNNFCKRSFLLKCVTALLCSVNFLVPH